MDGCAGLEFRGTAIKEDLTADVQFLRQVIHYLRTLFPGSRAHLGVVSSWLHLSWPALHVLYLQKWATSPVDTNIWSHDLKTHSQLIAPASSASSNISGLNVCPFPLMPLQYKEAFQLTLSAAEHAHPPGPWRSLPGRIDPLIDTSVDQASSSSSLACASRISPTGILLLWLASTGRPPACCAAATALARLLPLQVGPMHLLPLALVRFSVLFAGMLWGVKAGKAGHLSCLEAHVQSLQSSTLPVISPSMQQFRSKRKPVLSHCVHNILSLQLACCFVGGNHQRGGQ